MLALALAACTAAEPTPPPPSFAPEPEDAQGFLVSPFEGDAVAMQLFDHAPVRADRLVSAWGGTLAAGVFSSGHRGYDWYLATGTPIFAAADGVVRFAGVRKAFWCKPLGRRVGDQIAVEIEHVTPDGRKWRTSYDHLSATNFEKGDEIVAGDVVGLSGETGCASGAHLHFAVKRVDKKKGVAVDPYGWVDDRPDPSGVTHEWLWKEGEAPLLFRANEPVDPLSLLVRADSTGWDDASHPNNEVVVFDNYYWRWPRDCAIRNNRGEEHPIPGPTLYGPPTFSVYSGRGVDGPGVHFLGRDAPLWDDAGDCVHVVCGGLELEEHPTVRGTCSHEGWPAGTEAGPTR